VIQLIKHVNGVQSTKQRVVNWLVISPTSEAFLIDKNVANLIGERNKNRNAKSFRLAFSARHQCHWFREYKIAVKALPSHPEVRMLAKCLLTILLVAVLYGSGANAQTVADDIRLRFYFG
jgi:hypothetical protein